MQRDPGGRRGRPRRRCGGCYHGEEEQGRASHRQHPPPSKRPSAPQCAQAQREPAGEPAVICPEPALDLAQDLLLTHGEHGAQLPSLPFLRDDPGQRSPAGPYGPARTAAWKSSAGAPGCRGRRRVGTQGGRPAGVDPETSPRPPARRRPAEDPGQVIAPPRAGRFRRRRSRSSRSHTMTGRMPGRARPRPPPRAFPSAAAALTGGTPRIPAALSVVPRPIAPLLRRGARAERGETGNTGGRPGPPARPRALSGGGCRGRGLPGSRAARSRPITRRATSESSRLWWRAYAASGRAPRPRRSPLPRRPRPWPGPGRPGC